MENDLKKSHLKTGDIISIGETICMLSKPSWPLKWLNFATMYDDIYDDQNENGILVKV